MYRASSFPGPPSSTATANTPLLPERRELPLHSGQVDQDLPIFLRICHSPWRWITQERLAMIRCAHAVNLTFILAMVLGWKSQQHNIPILEDGGDQEGGLRRVWPIFFQFSTMAIFLLWLYKIIAFAWTFTHFYFVDDDEGHRTWENWVLWKLSPPNQTSRSRKGWCFSLFYNFVHVVVFMNAIIYWAILVPKGRGEEFFGSGWLQQVCIICLWGATLLLALGEVLFLNSMSRRVSVPSHVFFIMVLLAGYLGWAAIGHCLTGEYPLFWMDRDIVGSTVLAAAYSAGFISMGPIVFGFMHGLIWLREALTKKEGPPKRFDPVEFAQEFAQEPTGRSSQTVQESREERHSA